jgi:hypothetical protein
LPVLVPPPDVRPDVHHHGHLDGDGVGPALLGDALDQGVGHDLAATATVALGTERVRVPGQRGVDRDALGCGEKCGQRRHRVRRRSQRHPPVGVRPRGPVGHRVRVEAVALWMTRSRYGDSP